MEEVPKQGLMLAHVLHTEVRMMEDDVIVRSKCGRVLG